MITRPRPLPRPRPLLALASLVPLAAGATMLVLAPTTPSSTVSPLTATATPGPVTARCPGPLAIPEELLSASGDAQLAAQPPSTTIGLRAAAAETDSAVLFGRTTGSETARTADGHVIAPTISARTADGQDVPLTGSAQDLGTRIATAATVSGAADVTLATAQRSEPVADAVQSTLTPQGDFRSLSLTRCSAPAVDASFLGASTAEGSSSALVLTNTTDRPATASIQAWTSDGPADMQGRSRVVVAPHQQTTVLLESIVPGQQDVAVHVGTVGAPLAMDLQVTARDGLTPGGAEILSPLPDASQDLVIPAAVVAGSQPVAILLNTSGSEATADVEVAGADGALAGAGAKGVDVPAGGVVRVPLKGLHDGTYTVRVHGDVSLLGAVRSSAAGADLAGDTVGAPQDFAIAAPAPAIGSSSLLALPAEGPDGVLSLAADEAGAVTVVPLGADGRAGTPVSLDLAAGASGTVPASSLKVPSGAPAALAIVPEQPGAVHAAWAQTPAAPDGGRLLSSVIAPAGQGESDQLEVRLR